MPEFQMSYGSAADRDAFKTLDAFTQGYIEAMFWTEEEELGAATFADLDAKALATITADCKAFQESNAEDLEAYAEHLSMKHAGHDYWLTRNGHGAGFWDQGLGALGDRLSDACGWRPVYAYLGDDGNVHVS